MTANVARALLPAKSIQKQKGNCQPRPCQESKTSGFEIRGREQLLVSCWQATGKSARATQPFNPESGTCTQAQSVTRRLNNFHAESTTCTKIQRLSSKIIKNAIRGDFTLWKSFDDPEAGSPCKNRTTGLPAALASILRSQSSEPRLILRERPLRQEL
jgi:hypothetical protein